MSDFDCILCCCTDMLRMICQQCVSHNSISYWQEHLGLKISHLLQAFNGKKWEKFNSEKVASLAYARIQGKSALIAHFQNSSLMNEDKRCRPILFHTDGPNAGDPVGYHA
jgi:hypothetical protein